eukprot:TRINITY_DN21370_c0_g1_i1.p1 TRINITY_DN21370_c0_g1~~TRINITY_DN21370_c0_g1_i1.p1  ORF type:complete len:626 (-),score=59.78 TRINITY_DN21370_c0_g1_i1:466-2343(-)
MPTEHKPMIKHAHQALRTAQKAVCQGLLPGLVCCCLSVCQSASAAPTTSLRPCPNSRSEMVRGHNDRPHMLSPMTDHGAFQLRPTSATRVCCKAICQACDRLLRPGHGNSKDMQGAGHLDRSDNKTSDYDRILHQNTDCSNRLTSCSLHSLVEPTSGLRGSTMGRGGDGGGGKRRRNGGGGYDDGQWQERRWTPRGGGGGGGRGNGGGGNSLFSSLTNQMENVMREGQALGNLVRQFGQIGGGGNEPGPLFGNGSSSNYEPPGCSYGQPQGVQPAGAFLPQAEAGLANLLERVADGMQKRGQTRIDDNRGVSKEIEAAMVKIMEHMGHSRADADAADLRRGVHDDDQLRMLASLQRMQEEICAKKKQEAAPAAAPPAVVPPADLPAGRNPEVQDLRSQVETLQKQMKDQKSDMDRHFLFMQENFERIIRGNAAPARAPGPERQPGPVERGGAARARQEAPRLPVLHYDHDDADSHAEDEGEGRRGDVQSVPKWVVDYDALSRLRVDQGVHDHIWGVFAFSQKDTDKVTSKLAAAFGRHEGSAPLGEWWAAVRSVRSKEQWQRRLVGHEVDPTYAKKQDSWDKIGGLVICWLVHIGELRCPEILKDIIPIAEDPHEAVPRWPATSA